MVECLPILSYRLEVMGPQDWHDPLIVLDAFDPFTAIHVGDLVNPCAWSSERWPGVEDVRSQVVQVVLIEHGISELDIPYRRHLLRLYTQACPDTLETRRALAQRQKEPR